MAEQSDITEAAFTAPGGAGASIKSTSTIVLAVMLFLVVSGAFAFGVYRHEANDMDRHREMIAALKANADAVKAMQESQRESTEGMIWVLTRNQAERDKLDLSKPKFISNMQR